MRANRRLNPTTEQRGWTSSGRLLFLIGVSALGTLGLVVLATLWAGAESDAAARERQRQLMTARLSEQVQQVEHIVHQIGAGYLSGRAADVMGDPKASPPQGVGSSGADPGGARAAGAISHMALSIFGFDRAFVIDRAGQLVTQGDAQVQQRYRWTKPLLQPLLAELRSPPAPLSERDGRRLEAPAGSGAAAEPAGRAVAKLMRMEGHPTVVGIAALGDPQDNVADGLADTRYLIVIRFLDGAVLDKLSHEQGLTGARFARAADAEGSEVAFQIDATSSGEPIGFIVWTPDLPGSKVVGRLVPALSVAAIVLAILFGALLLRLRVSLGELRTSEHQARHLALHDVLTGLPNRALFATRLDHCLAHNGASGQRGAVALIDLDRFKPVNDTFGHAAGDELIRTAADRMQLCLRPQDTLARLGGDEFAILLPDIGEGDDVVKTICDDVLSRLSTPFALRHGEAIAHIGGSIGLAVIADGGDLAGEVMRYADIALYEAKTGGRGGWLMFQPSMDHGRGARAALKSDLRAALQAAMADPDVPEETDEPSSSPDPGSLVVYFQTIHSAAGGHAVSGAEALVRWRHGERGLLAPDAFIPIAEESGLIDKLGLWVLREACRAASTWPSHMTIAVNVSPSQLRAPHFVDDVLATLEQTGLMPSRLELELTESALIDDDRRTEATIARLRAEGVQISLDDFGTGFSSLTHLVRFGIDRLKIDRSFVALLGTRATSSAIVECIIGLGHSLGIATTAEGVETDVQRDLLVALGCSDLQGYLLCKPKPLRELTRFGPIGGAGDAAPVQERSAA